MARWFPFYADDWLIGCMDLSLMAEGAYIRVCAMIYSQGGPILDDDRWIAGMCRISTRKWRTIKAELEVAGKIEIQDGKIYQERCMSELENMAKVALKRAASGSLGGRETARKRHENASKTSRKRSENVSKTSRKNRENFWEFHEQSSNSLENNETRVAPAAANALANAPAKEQHRARVTTTITKEERREERKKTYAKKGKKNPGEAAEPATARSPQAAHQSKGNGKDQSHAKRTSQGTRLSPDWRPAEPDRQFALDLGLDPEAILAEFRDYWLDKTGRDATKRTWVGTWRNWCRRNAKPHRGNGSKPASLLAAATEVAARFASIDDDNLP